VRSVVGRSRRFDAWVPVLFMASGAASLIYQVVWTQDLVLVFGDTTLAIVTTVTAFLAGLGIGALVGAAVGARLRHALAVYGLLEMAVGCLALLMPLAFDVIATPFRSAYLSLPPTEVALIRFALSFVALTPVTLLMGMSLPVLTRHLVRSDPQVGERIARLYGLNTLGAVVGSAASGYVLIELLGLQATTYVAVTLNLGAGAAAVAISRTHGAWAGAGSDADVGAGLGSDLRTGLTSEPGTDQLERAPLTGRRAGRPPLTGRQRLLLGVTFVSGLVSLALEVLWTRVLLQATGSSIYVFVAVVSVFLIGIAAGSLAYERRSHRPPQVATLGALMAAAAGLALLPVIVSNVTGPPGMPYSVLLILPVTAIFGYTFPLTVALFVGTAAQASRGVGLVYAVNTAGCVAGTVCAGFVLIPVLGTNTAVITVSLCLAALGSALAITYAPLRELARPIVGASFAAVLVLMFFVPTVRLTFVQRQIAPTGVPTAHFDDSVATVDVTGGKPLGRKLDINGESITGLTIDTKLLAYIPKAARPNATTMLNICFGMGSTFRSSIILGLHTTAVELDPTVPTVMPWFFPDASTYLHSPLGHIIISDGRNYVRLSDKRYDLITVDPPPPVWSAGAVVLMTREFYQEASQRLAPGGVLTTFIGYGYEKLSMRTFRASFRYVTIIRGPRPYGMYMMGSSAPIRLSPAAIIKVFGTPAARADLGSAPDFPPVPTSAWPGIIKHQVWLTNNQVNRYAGPGPLLTDDHPTSEYFLLAWLGNHKGQPGSEKPTVRTAEVVLSLVTLLAIAIGLGAIWRPRRRALPST
jgi:spermidine synthase